MRARIRSFESPDAELDLGVPNGLSSLFLRMLVGPQGEPGEETFDLTVCTPAWLADRAADGPLLGRHLLVVPSINLDQVKSFLNAQVARLEEADWQQLAAKLSRIGFWEFEDYQDYQS
ncbi:hypothetical protein D1871_18760 [Nakamurella silvestris]|nr:hypothetical protein D1871_18760 [Nakamurella silvestris]